MKYSLLYGLLLSAVTEFDFSPRWSLLWWAMWRPTGLLQGCHPKLV